MLKCSKFELNTELITICGSARLCSREIYFINTNYNHHTVLYRVQRFVIMLAAVKKTTCSTPPTHSSGHLHMNVAWRCISVARNVTMCKQLEPDAFNSEQLKSITISIIQLQATVIIHSKQMQAVHYIKFIKCKL